MGIYSSGMKTIFPYGQVQLGTFARDIALMGEVHQELRGLLVADRQWEFRGPAAPRSSIGFYSDANSAFSGPAGCSLHTTNERLGLSDEKERKHWNSIRVAPAMN